ncbi:uncharacterized protein TRAVEDRAFT_50559 [Trametes versicolor FP-101664 SS1]|uniref:uncharacterized protein n=1 Tax=Trametes versicolor (strain FP-101664) TaxID=717944 RepID=UPI0004622289|nr:uncharacterized protein TRAVEDRAFT_50559 [Trametes versicolor FP-101664 SS1]EIW56071.1 hypothetical protein TRAVEDRAFT_50559 [Trametes versicolor FP-101664 SS1]
MSSSIPSITYDNDFDVAALLFAVGALDVPGIAVAAADLDRLGKYLGTTGKLYAICAHANALLDPAPDAPLAPPAEPSSSAPAPALPVHVSALPIPALPVPASPVPASPAPALPLPAPSALAFPSPSPFSALPLPPAQYMPASGVWGHPAQPTVFLPWPPVPCPSQFAPALNAHPVARYSAAPHPYHAARTHTPAYAPATTVAPISHTLAATQPVASSSSSSSSLSAPHPPSAKTLGKRKAAAEPDAPAPQDKKSRTTPARVEDEVKCQWEGCNTGIVAGDYRKHLLAKHWPDVTAVDHVKGRQVCKWVGDCKARQDPKTKDGLSDLTGLFKHLMDSHFGARNQPCGTCNKRMRPDALKKHEAICGKKS